MIIVDLIRMAENWHQVLAAECGSLSVTPLQYFDPYYTSTLCGQVLLDKNLVGHEGGNGVTDCSPSNVAGHQQSESASPDCPSYGQPNRLSAASSALSRLE